MSVLLQGLKTKVWYLRDVSGRVWNNEVALSFIPDESKVFKLCAFFVKGTNRLLCLFENQLWNVDHIDIGDCNENSFVAH